MDEEYKVWEAIEITYICMLDVGCNGIFARSCACCNFEDEVLGNAIEIVVLL